MLVLCSDEEGFPNVLVEAMAAGLPIVTTPAGESSAVVEDGVTGYVVTSDEPESALAERMVQLARSPELRVSLGIAGQRRVRQQYGFERLRHMVVAAYGEVAERKGHRGLLGALRSLTGTEGVGSGFAS
jgi:glycosyltransferase involved in cell wall biosynthesis